MWLSLRFLLSFYLLKGFFSSLSFLLLRVKGRGCHTLLKPYETNCGLWIWAIQIKFDWLIDWLFTKIQWSYWNSNIWPRSTYFYLLYIWLPLVQHWLRPNHLIYSSKWMSLTIGLCFFSWLLFWCDFLWLQCLWPQLQLCINPSQMHKFHKSVVFRKLQCLFVFNRLFPHTSGRRHDVFVLSVSFHSSECPEGISSNSLYVCSFGLRDDLIRIQGSKVTVTSWVWRMNVCRPKLLWLAEAYKCNVVILVDLMNSWNSSYFQRFKSWLIVNNKLGDSESSQRLTHCWFCVFIRISWSQHIYIYIFIQYQYHKLYLWA